MIVWFYVGFLLCWLGFGLVLWLCIRADVRDNSKVDIVGRVGCCLFTVTIPIFGIVYLKSRMQDAIELEQAEASQITTQVQ